MPIDPTGTITIVQVTGRGDPALDIENPALSEAVTLHARSRSAVTLDALRACVQPGRRLHEFRVIPPSPAAHAFLASLGNDSDRYVLAFRALCVGVLDAEGREHAPKITAGAGGKADGSFPLAPYSWYAQWHAARGMDAVREVGAVGYCRGGVGPEETDFYWPLAGVPRLMV